MNRMLVAVFDGEAGAYEGKFALLQLDAEGSITLFASAVIAMRADGTVAIRDQDAGPQGTLVGTPLGSLVALIGGPIRFSMGAGAGPATGMLMDLENARIGGDFIDDVRKALAPGKVLLIAELDETWTAPVDAELESLARAVFRRSTLEVRHATNEAEVVAIKTDIMQMQAEAAQAHLERKARLQARIGGLEIRLEEMLERGRWRRRAIREAARARVALPRKPVPEAHSKPR